MTTFSGGGGGGGGSKFVQRPDNLRSTDRFEGLLGLGAGPWKGLVNGFQSLTMNGTPIEDGEGNNNFEDFDAIFANGDPAQFPQKVELRLGAGGTPINIGLTVTNSNTEVGTGAPGPWLPQSIANLNADFLDLRFVVQQLFVQGEKGIQDGTANLEIQLKPSGASTWMNPQIDSTTVAEDPNGFYDQGGGLGVYLMRKMYEAGVYNPTPGYVNYGWFRITGKTTSAYVHEIRLAVPNTGAYANKSWDVRVRLRERDNLDADPDFEKRTIVWESISAGYNTVYGVTEPWRGLAWLQVYGKASNQLNGVPTLLGEFDTLIVPVPPSGVFNPDTRVYSGATWDGTWAQAFTTDPAWCINGLMQDSLHGLASIAPYARLNKWDALAASKWFSAQVPDGNGGTEPRSSLNLAINEPQKAKEFVQYLAGAVGAICWEGNQGEWHLRVDKPEQPVDILTLESVIGEFRYSNSDIEQRYNDITAVFRNKEFGYREDRVRVVDNAAIARFGRKPTTVTLIGCTGRQEALRRAIMRLRVANNETRSVRFNINRRGRLYERLDTILIADADLNRLVDEEPRSTGRIVALAPDRTWIDVRDPVRIEIGASYQLVYSQINPQYNPGTTIDPSNTEWLKPTLTNSIAVTNTTAQRGEVRRIYLASALPADIALNANVALSAPGLPSLPKPYRILGIEEGESEVLGVTAIEIDSGKWAASDAGVAEQEITVSLLDGVVPKPVVPTAGLLTAETVETETGPVRVIVVNWDRPNGGFLSGYRLQYRHNGAMWQNLGVVEESYYELPAQGAGTYDFRIYTIDLLGRESMPLLGSLTLDESLNPVGGGANAKLLKINSTRFVMVYDGEGNADPAVQTAAFVAVKQNTTGTVMWSVFDIDGVARTPTTAYLTSTTGDVVAMTQAQFEAARNGTDGVIVKATITDGITLTDQTSIVRVQAGATAAVGYLTNDSHTVGTAQDGSGGDFTGAGGQFQVWLGNVEITTDCTFSTVSTSALTASINSVGAYSATALSADDGYADFSAAALSGLELLKNPSFETGITDWTAIGNVVWAGGSVTISDVAGADASLKQTIPGTIAGRTYRVTLFVSAVSGTTISNAFRVRSDGTSQSVGHLSGLIEVDIVAQIDNFTLELLASSTDASRTVDYVSVREVRHITKRFSVSKSKTGTTGPAGLSIAELTIYRRAATAPATPTGGSYNMATQVLTPPTDWFSVIPAGSNPLYAGKGVAAVQGLTGTVVPTWYGSGLLVENGAAGSPGAAVNIMFKRSATQPATPAPSIGTPSGWYDDVGDVPAGDDPIWLTYGTRPNPTTNYTWQASLKAEGEAGVTPITATALPSIIQVPVTNAGTPKAAIPGFQITVKQGAADVTALATYGARTYSNMAGASVSSGGLVSGTITLSANAGWIQVPVSYAGQSTVIRVPYNKLQDANSSVYASANLGPPNLSGTYNAGDPLDIVVPPGITITVSASLSYLVNDDTYSPQGKLTLQNLTDGGAETDIGSAAIGSESTPPVPPFNPSGSPGTLGVSSSFTNSTGVAKNYRVRLKTRKNSGNASSFFSFGGTIAGNS